MKQSFLLHLLTMYLCHVKELHTGKACLFCGQTLNIKAKACCCGEKDLLAWFCNDRGWLVGSGQTERPLTKEDLARLC